jgi:hypothetical protein
MRSSSLSGWSGYVRHLGNDNVARTGDSHVSVAVETLRRDTHTASKAATFACAFCKALTWQLTSKIESILARFTEILDVNKNQ